ncbi:MAG: hypothetical protein ACWA5A_11000 [Marinibacterium sp.]
MASKTYCGIDKDIQGGMTATGKIIRDAWVFGLIPETETCEGWLPQGIESLWEKVGVEWDRYGYSVSALPEDLKETYLRIQTEAVERARAAGWRGEQELAADE